VIFFFLKMSYVNRNMQRNVKYKIVEYSNLLHTNECTVIL